LGTANVDPEARPEEGPVHQVTLAPYFLSKLEMTIGQWLRLGGDRPSSAPAGAMMFGETITPRNPVTRVNWRSCYRILGRHGLVLPTEAQWEYACRGGTATPFSTGEKDASLEGYANVASSGDEGIGFTRKTFSDGWIWHAPAGTFKPNPFGFHDMHGNVSEWCRDEYWPTAYQMPVLTADGLRMEPRMDNSVVRGGHAAWASHYARSSMRNSHWSSGSDQFLGLRPARSLRE
jgi:formylglycine-generating enzyme required for sulfatase activity